MPKTPSPAEFRIHVDSSCLTDSNDLQMAPTERIVSDRTVVHHVSKAPGQGEEKVADEVAVESEDDGKEEEDHVDEDRKDEKSDYDETRNARVREIDRIEAHIQAAARAVVASIEKDHYGTQDDSVLSTQMEESYRQEESYVPCEEGTEFIYGDGTELTYDCTETSYEPRSEHEEEVAGDSSSHHDGDIDDDDVFSRNSGHSARSSLNSANDLSSADVSGKELTSPAVGEEAVRCSPSGEEDSISRIPSSTSYTQRDATPATPSKGRSRPPFRTPSSVRELQMSSPTPSLFSSPRSSKRHLPTVSRTGTPTFAHSPNKNRTPTRFKVKKENPLVLLHITVLPLIWSYSHIISSPELPLSLHRVRENWRLLQEKLGDTVLERGILLPHPQESYEILEERLLEALELPVRPRARILKCGHYMGPETPASSDEEGVAYFEGGKKVEGNRRWCDICGCQVRLDGVDMAGREGDKRFRIKIYASNGLMTAGAWAACWREMEKVDAEIEPFLEGELVTKLEDFSSLLVFPKEDTHEDPGDGFFDVEKMPAEEYSHEVENRAMHEEQIGVQKEEEIRRTSMEEELNRRAQQEEEMARTLIEEEDLRCRLQEQEYARRKLQNEARMREVYGNEVPLREPSSSRLSTRVSSRSALDDDSLSDLLLKAFNVAIRDKKNIVICVLSIVVLLLTLRTGSATLKHPQVIMADSAPARDVVIDSGRVPIQEPAARAAEVSVGLQEVPVLQSSLPSVERTQGNIAGQPAVGIAVKNREDESFLDTHEEKNPDIEIKVPAAAEKTKSSLDEASASLNELPLEAAIMHTYNREERAK